MPSWNQVTLLIVPWLLLATTYLTYQLLERRFGKKISYLGGFLFYWIVRSYSLDGLCAYYDRFLSIGMGCPVQLKRLLL